MGSPRTQSLTRRKSGEPSRPDNFAATCLLLAAAVSGLPAKEAERVAPKPDVSLDIKDLTYNGIVPQPILAPVAQKFALPYAVYKPLVVPKHNGLTYTSSGLLLPPASHGLGKREAEAEPEPLFFNLFPRRRSYRRRRNRFFRRRGYFF